MSSEIYSQSIVKCSGSSLLLALKLIPMSYGQIEKYEHLKGIWDIHYHKALLNTKTSYYFLLQGSSQPRDRTQVSRIAGRFFNL